MQDNRSDPESVTSSLTASSNESRTNNERGIGISVGNTNTRKNMHMSGRAANVISLSSESRYNNNDGGTLSGHVYRENATGNDVSQQNMSSRSSSNKKTTDASNKIKVEDEGISSIDSSSEEGNGSGGPRGKNISVEKMSSSMSEMSDSNRSSSDQTQQNFEKKSVIVDCGKSSKDKDDENSENEEQVSSSSISSTAAVISGVSSREYHNHADVVIKENSVERKRKRKKKEKTSLDSDFTLDYEEVFLTSNIPQLIATPAGRIVTCKSQSMENTILKNHYSVANSQLFFQ